MMCGDLWIAEREAAAWIELCEDDGRQDVMSRAGGELGWLQFVALRNFANDVQRTEAKMLAAERNLTNV